MGARPLTALTLHAHAVGRVNVASGFRQTQKLQVVKSTKRSEIPRPSFNHIFRVSLSTCMSISVSIASTACFGEFSKSAENPLSETNPESSNIISRKLRKRFHNFFASR
jgi:hypothetical protein